MTDFINIILTDFLWLAEKSSANDWLSKKISNKWFFFLLFPTICYIHASCKVMQSKFMSVKCLPDGELPEDEKRNLAVRGLLLAATEDKYESINYLLLWAKKEKEVIFLWRKQRTCFSPQPKSWKPLLPWQSVQCLAILPMRTVKNLIMWPIDSFIFFTIARVIEQTGIFNLFRKPATNWLHIFENIKS